MQCFSSDKNPSTPQTFPSAEYANMNAGSSMSPMTRMLGPTPNNTPAAGLPLASMEECIIQRAVQGLTEVSSFF